MSSADLPVFRRKSKSRIMTPGADLMADSGHVDYGEMVSTEKRFLADSMLGKLARWLRVMGFDTHYQPYYDEKTMDRIINDGFTLLSRHRKKILRYPAHSILILSDRVEHQLQELRKTGYIPSHRSRWFTRCLLCNTLLKAVSVKDARENIPEYVYYQNVPEVRFCPSCGRYFWPGSHRNRMVNQLREWGITSRGPL